MIDVGQGDSTLIELPYQKRIILIDTGGNEKSTYSYSKSVIIPYLKSRSITKIDYLILSHGDADHALEALNLVNKFKVKHILMNSGTNSEYEQRLEKFNPIHLSENKLVIDNILFKFLNRKLVDNENEDSLVIHMTLNNKNILFMGDAGKSTEEYLLDEYNLNYIDILKVGHHGSKNSSSEKFLDKIKPKYALIGAGKNNMYGHPHQETINRFNKRDIVFYTTSTSGSIKMLVKNNIIISTCLKTP